MNQIFRITVGQETLQGRLPSVRVGKGYCCRFHIYGVDYSETTVPPKIWVATGTETLFWTGVWSDLVGAWVVDVNTDATLTAGAKSYALTVFSPDAVDKEFLVGQAAFVVFNSVAAGGETGGTAGDSVSVRLSALEALGEIIQDDVELTQIGTVYKLPDIKALLNSVVAYLNTIRSAT